MCRVKGEAINRSDRHHRICKDATPLTKGLVCRHQQADGSGHEESLKLMSAQILPTLAKKKAPARSVVLGLTFIVQGVG